MVFSDLINEYFGSKSEEWYICNGNVWKCPSMHQAWQKEYRHSLVPKTAPLSENSVDVGDKIQSRNERCTALYTYYLLTYSISRMIIQLRTCLFFVSTLAAQLYLASHC